MPEKRASVSGLQLLQMWTHEEIRVVCRRPAHLEDHPDLALRVRGAFGRQLSTFGPPITWRFDPFSRPRAFDHLFGNGAAKAARPFALDVDVLGDAVVVDLRLFGWAALWADQCREALLASLAQGVALRANGRQRVTFDPLDCLMRRKAADLPPSQVAAVRLTLLTPTAVRAGQAVLTTPAALLFAAITRVKGLAEWLHVDLLDDFRSLHEHCRAAHVMSEELLPFGSRRFSQRRRDRDIPVVGLLGSFSVQGELSALAPFLQLAEYTHIGSHAALGLGRIRVTMWP